MGIDLYACLLTGAGGQAYPEVVQCWWIRRMDGDTKTDERAQRLKVVSMPAFSRRIVHCGI